MMNLFVLTASTIANLLLASLIYSKNPRAAINRTFAALVSMLALSAVTTYVAFHVSSPLPFVKMTMVLAAVMILSFKWFSLTFPDRSLHFSKRRKFELLATLIVSVLMLTPLTFPGIKVSVDNVQPEFGPGIVSFVLLFAYCTITGLWLLYSRFHHAHSKVRSQLQYVLIAAGFLFIALSISSLVAPIIFKFSIGVAFNAVIYVIFAAIISVAIVKRQLFDIRAVAARSLAYLLLLSTLVLLYAVGLFILSSLFFATDKVGWQYKAVNLCLAILLAYTFPFLKRFFDRLTQRIFFRLAYDSANVIDSVTDMLVSTISLEAIMSKSLAILSDNLGISNCQLVVLDRGRIYRIESHGSLVATDIDVKSLLAMSDDIASSTYSTNEDSHGLLAKLDKEIIVRLKTKDTTIGYFLASAKSSGVSYTSQDMEVLQITSKTLAVAIHNAMFYEKIEHFNETLQERVQHATKELRRSNEKLKQLDETKDEFISMASHQLRTPLTSVKGYLSMVLEGDTGELNPGQRQMLSQSYASAQRMVYLISDLLNLSRLNTGKLVIETGPVDLRDIVAAEIDQLRETAKAREINLSYDPPKEFPTLMLDETKTHQVVMNFMDNAIYYTPPGGSVSIILKETATTVEFSVKDSGIGVARDVQRHLFSKFYRAENARRVRPDGTGLGLFMAKKIVIAEGGAIIFESEEGKGSTFGFRFQKASHAVADSSKKPE